MITETGKQDIEKLVEDVPLGSFDMTMPKTPPTKKRIRRIADSHIRGKKIKGHVYYYYCRGIDREVYLGDADTILRAIRGSHGR